MLFPHRDGQRPRASLLAWVQVFSSFEKLRKISFDVLNVYLHIQTRQPKLRMAYKRLSTEKRAMILAAICE
ncbi:MAG TPA: hypothetical protein VIJ46_05060, partial [Rhabdochlamydiaceae bacterium]